MDYINYRRFIRNAIKNKTYLPTYGAFGVGAVLALVYMTDWETVGRHIPIWKYHFDDPVTVKNDTTDETSSST